MENIVSIEGKELKKDFQIYLDDKSKATTSTTSTAATAYSYETLDNDGLGHDCYGKWKPFGEKPEEKDYSDKTTIFFYENSDVNPAYRLKFYSAKSFLKWMDTWNIKMTTKQREMALKRTNIYAICQKGQPNLILGIGHEVIEMLTETWSLSS